MLRYLKAFGKALVTLAGIGMVVVALVIVSQWSPIILVVLAGTTILYALTLSYLDPKK